MNKKKHNNMYKDQYTMKTAKENMVLSILDWIINITNIQELNIH